MLVKIGFILLLSSLISCKSENKKSSTTVKREISKTIDKDSLVSLLKTKEIFLNIELRYKQKNIDFNNLKNDSIYLLKLSFTGNNLGDLKHSDFYLKSISNNVFFKKNKKNEFEIKVKKENPCEDIVYDISIKIKNTLFKTQHYFTPEIFLLQRKESGSCG